MGDATLERPGHAFEGRAATQRDLDRWETWADRDLLKYSQEKCQVWPLGQMSAGTTGELLSWNENLELEGQWARKEDPGSNRANSLPGTREPADHGMW